MRELFRLAVRTLLAALAFISLVIVALGGPADAKGVDAALKIRLLAAVVVIVASAALLTIGKLPKKYPHQDESLGPPNPSSPTVHDIVYSMNQATRKYSSDVLFVFQRMLQDPSHYLARANESIHICDGHLRQEVSLGYAINDESSEMISKAGDQIILVPVMRLKKGMMLDNLELWYFDDKPLGALLQSEVNGLLAFILDRLFRWAFMTDPSVDGDRQLAGFEAQLYWALLQLVCSINPVSPDTRKAVSLSAQRIECVV